MADNHIVVCAISKKVKCKNCGTEKPVPLGEEVSKFCFWLEQFNKKHEKCQKVYPAFEYDTGRYYDDVKTNEQTRIS